MACMTLFAPAVAMATTQVKREWLYEVSAPLQFGQDSERQPLRMNWVVVTDRNGMPRLRMQWASVEDC